MAYTQAAIVSTAVIFPVIIYILVATRFWMRLRFQKTFLGADDWLILVATVLTTGMAVGYILNTIIGTMGFNGAPIPPSHLIPQKKLDFAQIVFEKPAYGAIKLSVLLFFRRIFTTPSFKRLNTALMILIAAWSLAFFLADLLSCGSHIDANWDPQEAAKGYCTSTWVTSFVFSLTDVLTDAAIIWMPYPEIKRLKMSEREKWAVAGVFALGGLDFVVGLVRFGFIIATESKLTTLTGKHPRRQTTNPSPALMTSGKLLFELLTGVCTVVPAFNSNSSPPEVEAPGFWTFIEVSFGVIAANMPTLSPLFKGRRELRRMRAAFGWSPARIGEGGNEGKAAAMQDSTAEKDSAAVRIMEERERMRRLRSEESDTTMWERSEGLSSTDAAIHETTDIV